ncbi:MAG: ABC transporter ATP-binding protein [Nocardioidaceae bacterium]
MAETRAAAPSAAEITVTDLIVQYQGSAALRGVSATFGSGATAVLGSNGAGKSTLLKALSGLVTPTSGSVVFEGRDVTRRTSNWWVRNGVAHVPEGRQVFGSMTVEENLRMGGYCRSRREIARTMTAMYDLFPRLRERRHQHAATMSGGEQQMLAIARGLMARPKMLLLDEPSLGLAPKVVDELGESLVGIGRDLGVSLVLVEQNTELAFRVAQACVALRLGSVVFAGDIDRIRGDRDLLTSVYLGM